MDNHEDSDKDRLYYEIRKFLRNNKADDLMDVVNDALKENNNETSGE